MAGIYDFDVSITGPQLVPPHRRLPKRLSWIYAILLPAQWAWNNLFNDFTNGSTAPIYDPTATYNFGDQAVWSDRKVYQCVSSAPITATDPTDTNNWLKVLDNFIGARERLKYNAQRMVFEYALNRWFFNIGAANLIYISNNAPTYQPFVMGQTSAYSSTMPNNSIYANYFMANAISPILTDYTIYVPVALFNTLGTSNSNRERVVRNFADLYNLAGMKYDVVTY